jgi:hypothetical protein
LLKLSFRQFGADRIGRIVEKSRFRNYLESIMASALGLSHSHSENEDGPTDAAWRLPTLWNANGSMQSVWTKNGKLQASADIGGVLSWVGGESEWIQKGCWKLNLLQVFCIDADFVVGILSSWRIGTGGVTIARLFSARKAREYDWSSSQKIENKF